MKHATPHKHSVAMTALTAFLLSLLVFGSVLLIPAVIGEKDAIDPIKVDSPPAHVWHIGLFIREDTERLSGVVLLTVDTQTMRLSAVGFSPSIDLGGMTLQQRATDNGFSPAFDTLCEEMGTTGDGVVVLSVSDLATFIVHLKERLPLTLPEAIGTLPSGENTLTPMQVADVLRYTAWSDGESTRAAMHARVIAAIFDRYLLPERDLEADFKKLTALCDEPLSISQFMQAREPLQAIAEHNDGHICTVDSHSLKNAP